MLIGVVAALTIPFFYQEFNKQRWTITFKKTFAETFNALTRLALEENCDKSLTCTHVFQGGITASTIAFGNGLSSVMAVGENCGIKEGEKCFSHKIKVGLSGKNEQTLKETMIDRVSFSQDKELETGFYTFRTVRGVSYAVLGFGMNCLNTTNVEEDSPEQKFLDEYVSEQHDPDNPMLNFCGFIIIDVNGPQKPNIWGRDVFGMWVTDRKSLGLYPFGGKFDNAFSYCAMSSKDDEQDTRGCAAQIIEDGWVMKY